MSFASVHENMSSWFIPSLLLSSYGSENVGKKFSNFFEAML